MKKHIAIMALFLSSQAFAENKKMDASKPAAPATAENKDSTYFRLETIERNVYVLEMSKDGKFKVASHEMKKPFAEINHPKDWKGDEAKTTQAIKDAVNAYRKDPKKNTAATLYFTPPADIENFLGDLYSAFSPAREAIKPLVGTAMQVGAMF